MIVRKFQFQAGELGLTLEIVCDKTSLVYDPSIVPVAPATVAVPFTATPSAASRMPVNESKDCPGEYSLQLPDAQTPPTVFVDAFYTERVRDASGNLVPGGVRSFQMVAGDDGSKGVPFADLAWVGGQLLRVYGTLLMPAPAVAASK